MIELLSFGTVYFINIMSLAAGVILWRGLKIRAAGPLFGGAFLLAVGSYIAVPLLNHLSVSLLPVMLWFFNFGLAAAVMGLLPLLSTKVKLPEGRGRYIVISSLAFINWLAGMLANLSIWF